MALKFTVHGVQSFIKGHRKSGVISIKHSRDITNRISPLTEVYVTATVNFQVDWHKKLHSMQENCACACACACAHTNLKTCSTACVGLGVISILILIDSQAKVVTTETSKRSQVCMCSG